MNTISDLIRDPSIFKAHKFNLVHAPCGTGKSYFVANNLLSIFPDVKPSEVVFLTSRAITVAQQVAHYPTLQRFDTNSMEDIEFWRGELQETKDDKIRIMTYDKAIAAVTSCNIESCCNFRNIKIFVVDECHSLVTDKFIKNIEALVVCLRYAMMFTDMIVIGLTATPEVLLESVAEHGFSINLIEPEVRPAYKAKQLTMITKDQIAAFIKTSNLHGKTMIMMRDITAAREIQHEIPNSAILVSRNNQKDWVEEDMRPIWDSIVNDETLPDTFTKSEIKRKRVVSQKTYPLDVLITTSVFREGLNLRESSGVRNVICWYSDAMHVVQLAGRCRYNIDNLVVVSDGLYGNSETHRILAKQRDMCNRFYHRVDNEYFGLIRGIVQHPVQDTKFFCKYSTVNDFRDYIMERYAFTGVENTTFENMLIGKNDREEMMSVAKSCGLVRDGKTPARFKDLLAVMPDKCGIEGIKVKKSIHGVRKQGWCFTKQQER